MVPGVTVKAVPTFRVVKECPGRFPIQVVDESGSPHLELSVYASKARETLSPKSVPVYLGEIIRLFSWSREDRILKEENLSLLGPANEVRRILTDYLTADCKCVVRHREDSGVTTFITVRRTNETRVNVNVTLAAMKHFYSVLLSCDLYRGIHPLISEQLSKSLSNIFEAHQLRFEIEHGRKSPTNSGGVDDNWRHRLRYSTNYFQIADGEWRPKLIDDSSLPSATYRAGADTWKLRDTIIARMLFESGARVGEVVTRTFDDWLKHSCLNRMDSDSKGSHGNRVKSIVFKTETATLLRRYFNTERAASERGSFKSLADLQSAVRHGRLDARSVPIFLTTNGRPYTASAFRDYYWRPAMTRAGLKCQPHQARHWFVTTALAHIDEVSISNADREKRRSELVSYMAWRSGPEMLTTYDHTGARAAARMQSLHAHMDALEDRYQLEKRNNRIATDSKKQIEPLPAHADLAAILNLGEVTQGHKK